MQSDNANRPVRRPGRITEDPGARQQGAVIGGTGCRPGLTNSSREQLGPPPLRDPALLLLRHETHAGDPPVAVDDPPSLAVVGDAVGRTDDWP